ncbi:RsmB/NOP family class I SAM-dependent RNA methyltransferase [Kocuria palustris]|uniref:RsmB/NOP family class I SAM-dependent RNA methyltransferase n=1 Tax=Kocuria palustris TaxID=71999 RepID=UPI0011A3CDEC|nr:transcription antitermination factor NusB [Kocuria palustris]
MSPADDARGQGRGGRGRSGGRPDGDRRDRAGRQRHRRSLEQRSYSSSAPSRRTRGADPARLAAFRTLREVSGEDAYGNLVLPRQIREQRLDRRDAGFATELAYGALRHQGTWDAVLARCVDRPLERLDAPVVDVLRLGAHQILAMRVPVHAAIDQTVGLTRAEIGAGPSGLVNAVLRKVAARPLEEWIEQLSEGSSRERRLGIAHAHPEWIVRAMGQALSAHGRSPAEIEALLEADNAPASVHLTALPGLGAIEEELDGGAEPGPLTPDSAISAGGDLRRSAGVRSGGIRVQDSGSQLVARTLAAARPVVPGEHWLDLCAGPGGKAALLAALADRHGATLLANEVSEHRARLVDDALAALPERAWQIRWGDGREIASVLAEPDHYVAAEGFDRILVDAPCTGLGALRRRPEARWRRRPSDLADLTLLQAQLLPAAADALRPGGLLLYATCSPHAAETIAAVDDLLRARPDLRLIDAAQPARDAALPGALDGAADPSTPHPGGPNVEDGARTVQLWPHVHGTDGMFMALFEKTP